MASLKQQPAHYITVGEKKLPLIVKKHPRARNLVVRYDAASESVRVTVPRYASVKSAVEFVASKTGWIQKQLDKVRRVRIEDGAVVPLFGKEITIRYVGGRGLTSIADSGGEEPRHILNVTGSPEFLERRVRDWIMKEMKTHVANMAAHYANALGVRHGNIRIGDMRSRWGSCTEGGALSFSFRLAFAPLAVLDYVVCHEVSHIVHLNHSPRYWKTVAAACPDYEMHEAWLTRHGQSLWNYG